MAGRAVYFDGVSPVRREAGIDIGIDALVVTRQDGVIIRWPFKDVRLIEEGDASIYGRADGITDTGERLEIYEPSFTAAISQKCLALEGTAAERRRSDWRIAGWSAAAAVSIVLVVIYLVPVLAGVIAPLVPWRFEAAIGRAVEGEALKSLLGDTKIKFCESPDGIKALAKLTERLTGGQELPGPVIVRVLDHPMENAFALPGGNIAFFRGLIEKAQSADEVAGVLAHELGHVANRDAMRSLIYAGGLSFLAGTLLGDFTGATGMIFAAKILLGTRYSRENETDADRFGVDLINRSGGDARSLAAFLKRAADMGPLERNLSIVLTHPVTEDRIKDISQRARHDPLPSILSPAEWQALKDICKS